MFTVTCSGCLVGNDQPPTEIVYDAEKIQGGCRTALRGAAGGLIDQQIVQQRRKIPLGACCSRQECLHVVGPDFRSNLDIR